MLRVVRPDVLYGGSREPPDQRDELDLLRVERVGVVPGEGNEADGDRADEQRGGEARAEAEREQLLFLRVLRLAEVASIHRPAGRDRVEDGAGDRPGRAGRK